MISSTSTARRTCLNSNIYLGKSLPRSTLFPQRLAASSFHHNTRTTTSTHSRLSSHPVTLDTFSTHVKFAPSSNQSVRMTSNTTNAHMSRDNLFSMKNRVALVTGGGSGIGLMATQALVSNGAKVYITGRTKEKLDRVVSTYSDGPDSIVPIQCDITDKKQIANLVKDIESRESCLCILINNAGIAQSTHQTEASSAEEMRKNLFDADNNTFDSWSSIYTTNAVSPYFVTTAFLPLLQKASERHHGYSAAVINITSISGIIKESQHHYAYNVSKGAANHLTRMLSSDIAGNGFKIRVNAIAPGVFPSEMTTDGSDQTQKSAIDAEKYKNKVPAGRPGRDEDMGQAILFVAANQYLNGITIPVDGGYTIAAGE